MEYVGSYIYGYSLAESVKQASTETQELRKPKLGKQASCLQTFTMNVKILSKETIKPSAPTPHHLRNYKVSLLDQFAPSSYIPFILFYPSKFADRDTVGILTQLKESLSQILTVYYPLAGRVKGTLYVECNDEGVEFIEAQANGSLSEFLKRPDIAALNNFLPCNGDGLEKGSNIAPAAIKTTAFECGGVVIGVCMFHKVVDAGTAAVFLNNWAKIARGSNDEKVDHPNFASGSSNFPPRESLTGDFVRDFDNFYFQGSRSFMRRFVFDATAIRTLRNKAASEKIPNPSRVEALTAFVAEHLGAASRTAKSDAPETLMITHAVNLRQRIEPPLPDNTFGNILWLAFVFYECDPSETKIKTGDLVEMLREAFAGLNKESISELETDDAFTALSELLQSVYTNENIKIYRFTSWCNMGLYDIDFGLGKPVWVAHTGDMVGYRSKQQFVFIETGQNNGIELWLAADEQELSILEKDPGFLAYASPNPSIYID